MIFRRGIAKKLVQKTLQKAEDLHCSYVCTVGSAVASQGLFKKVKYEAIQLKYRFLIFSMVLNPYVKCRFSAFGRMESKFMKTFLMEACVEGLWLTKSLNDFKTASQIIIENILEMIKTRKISNSSFQTFFRSKLRQIFNQNEEPYGKG